MKEKEIDILCDGVYAAASNLSTFILGSCTFLLTIFLIKIFSKKQTFKILEVEIPLTKLWVVLAAYTLGHFYFSLILNQRIDKLKSENIASKKEEIWTQITFGEKVGSLFSNMEKRTERHENKFLGTQKYTMKKGDVTTWISVFISLLLFLTAFDFKAKSWRQKIYSAYFGLVFCFVNWTIGGWWAIKISTLAP